MNIYRVKIACWIILFLQVSGIHAWTWQKIGNKPLTHFEQAVLQGMVILALLICYK